MRTGVFAGFAQTAIVLAGRRWIFSAWLALTAAAAVGGWFCGRSQVVVKQGSREETRAFKSRRSNSVFAADSPKGNWSERVKKATSSDFPRLLEEWKSLFPETENYLDGQPEHALRWLFAQWLVRDQEGFVKLVADKDFQYSHWAAQVISRMKPELAADWLIHAGSSGADRNLIDDLASELANSQPTLYLKLNPDGTTDFTPDGPADDDWERALETLAKTDPVLAANTWGRRKLQNDHDQVLSALLPVLEAWKEGGPSIRDWVNQIEDPEIRQLAQHARLMVLAGKDAHAALAELYSTPLEKNNDFSKNAPSVILAELARQDLPAALRLLKETSQLFQRSDPFADPSGKSSNPDNPFVIYSSAGDFPEDNLMRFVILNEAADQLPEKPDELMATLHQLRAEMVGDSPWQRKVEAELIRKASGDFSVDSCFTAAKLWDSELNGARDDETYQSLAARAAIIDPERAEAALGSLPEAARAPFAAEIVKRLPPDEIERRIELLDQLAPAQWDSELGKSLGRNAADYADAIAAIPSSTTSGALAEFTQEWVEDDPDAAINWLSKLPQDGSSTSAALGVFYGWVSFDSTAAINWAESLPDGPARQAVAYNVVKALGKRNPSEAWRWAASIADPQERAWAYNSISIDHKDAPEAFKTEHEAVLRAAGMN